MKSWLADAAATEDLGRDLINRLLPGANATEPLPGPATLPVLLLRGALGAGKTCLTRGLARGLGIEEPITSPTFALAQHYSGWRHGTETALVHLDLYRLEQPAAADELFLQEQEQAEERGALLVVEWPERLSFTPPGSWTVQLEIVAEGRLARLSAATAP
ncbi:tRNA (adenosine(37)-N6)-threonylcarbamoyltransferase complex ATPase subunit type 1 TsaE [Synechococcus sp. RSCCF101]|uniref:tRNA (adenosine(37)-N6)-threonylcarbamoyltransferase complex ATPase subunit type 1 TsaE n=1 Tax=Synechococcus sp. RSCCF101 TaxID=2511069 RepID=UPI001245E625|nr:tRNA (adenosine(37)-N6)-threonylcarbamoyltransferase complex ATPase subunit type 1 TsaE [Synechococcus sp. RSCCF101]QEY32491.1 tRNA (adenosine(37)-N6)-threonylcarbamoyltransferase complex ATPase subunit type 1 TsaE [Synechococcus sp. RSCCF101]